MRMEQMLAILSVVFTSLSREMVSSDLTATFVSRSPPVLRLSCSGNGLPLSSHIITISINNNTFDGSIDRQGGRSSNGNEDRSDFLENSGGGTWRSNDDRTLALLTARDGFPKLGGKKVSSPGSSRYVAGSLHNGDLGGSVLELLLLEGHPGHVESFACQVSYLDENNALKILHYEVEVRFDAALPAKGEDMKSATEGTTHAATVELHSGSDVHYGPGHRTDADMLPSTGAELMSSGIPMYVVVALLAMISLLLLLMSTLLLQKIKERCATVRVPAAAAHYAITGEEVPVWDEHKGGYRDSRPSLHTVGLRSHYSFPRPLNPPPVPPPTFLPSLKRERHHYTESCSGPLGMTRSYHYTTPYDAVLPDDGELSLLNTSAHCDVTPALPPEQVGEITHKAQKAEAEVQTTGLSEAVYSSFFNEARVVNVE